MVDEAYLLDELENARLMVETAKEKVEAAPSATSERSDARLSYLHALVHHMSIVSVLQAKQHAALQADHQQLVAEVEELRALGTSTVH